MQGAEGSKISAVYANKVGIQIAGKKEGHAHLCVSFMETIVSSLPAFSSHTPFHGCPDESTGFLQRHCTVRSFSPTEAFGEGVRVARR